MYKDRFNETILNLNEKMILLLFFTIVIISQGIRGYINNTIGTSIFNYHIIPIVIIMTLFLNKRNKFSKINMILFIFIASLIIIGYLKNRYGFSDLFRVIMGFLCPLIILLLDYTDIRVNLIFPKIVKSFNLFIYISFIFQAFISLNSGRTGGIVGHPLTAGWYYAIFISFNMILCKFFKDKKDILVLLDILIALIGTVLAAGRISLFSVIALSLVYTFTCCKRRVIPYVILPVIMLFFLSTSIVDEYIWAKFRETASWGDITNGRLLGIREIEFYDKYPDFFIGRGIGYSNYVSQYIFGVVNFENPLLMFSYDYGILSTILLMFLIFIIPLISFIKNKNFMLIINFIILTVIPFSYNGLAETVGIFIVLIFLVYIFLAINFYISLQL